MMSTKFWKEIVIYQICSGSISLVASSVIVTFIALKGLSTPYRRLIFSLSISDILLSFAILSGPWLTRSDVDQALWGVGNKHTCRFDGLLYLVGSTTTPMYTVCLCVYYVCKLKDRMTDAQFACRIEKKMHITIIVSNLVLYFTALGMDIINPTFLGNFCAAAPVPTGCNVDPEIYGECIPNIEEAAYVFTFISIVLVPVMSLLGIIVCIVMIFWHVLKREIIFGRTRTSLNTSSNQVTHGVTAEATAMDTAISEQIAAMESLSGQIEAMESSTPSVTTTNDQSGSEIPLRHRHDLSLDESEDKIISDTSQQSLPHICSLYEKCGHRDDESRALDDAIKESEASGAFNLGKETSNPGAIRVSDWSLNANVDLPGFTQDQREHCPNQFTAPSGAHFSSNQYRAPTAADSTRNVELEASLSRLYKKELLTQGFCYVVTLRERICTNGYTTDHGGKR